MTQPLSLERILDANLNRSREGLRVIEDWCRLGLNNVILAQKCKAMRQDLAKWHHEEFKRGRDTSADLGTDISHPGEERRESPQAILKANFGRLAEALRVLEEYSKLYNNQMAKDCKQMRYQVYILETQLCITSRLAQLQSSSLYLVTSPHPNLFNVVEAALDGGLSLLQYREKQSDGDDLTRLHRAEELAKLCQKYNALFIINDRVDIALAVGADGVHLGQQDLPVELARKILGAGTIVGRSTTNSQELKKALDEGVDYIGVGPIYKTPTKAGKEPVGYGYIQHALKHSQVPWFAIGGIDRTNLELVVEAGAKQVAVVRAIMEAEDPKRETRRLLSILRSEL